MKVYVLFTESGNIFDIYKNKESAKNRSVLYLESLSQEIEKYIKEYEVIE